MNSIYVLVPKSKITQAMINLSTSNGVIARLPEFNGAYIIETEHVLHDVFIDYPHYTAEEIRLIIEKGESSSWTSWFTALFGT